MKALDNITIVGVAGTKAKETLWAIKYSCKDIKFGRAVLITPEDIEDDEVEIIKCEPLNYEQYNHFIIYRLNEYIKTDFALVVQNDGYVVNSNQWDDMFLNYDYIGAVWPLPQDDFSFRDEFGDLYRMGNGGFSLRSKKLLSLANELNLPWKEYYGFYHEDGFVCVHNRKTYEKHGCVFADLETASKFSHESNVLETQGKIPFGFHGKNHPYYKLTQSDI